MVIKKRTRYLFQVGALLLLVPGIGMTVSAGTIDQDLQSVMAAGDDVDIIVRFSDQVDTSGFPGRGKSRGMQLASLIYALKDQADTSQAEALTLLRQGGASRLVKLWLINGLAATADSSLVETLASLPQVESVSLDGVVEGPIVESATTSTPEWNIGAIRAQEMWAAGYDGSGTVVASMDSGVDKDHPDLAGSWRGGSNSWYDPYGQYSDPWDNTGHGTQVTSLMVGGDYDGTTLGVAPGAQWIAVKIFNRNNNATYSAIHQGFQWLLDPDGKPATDDAPHVINNSWSLNNVVDKCVSEFNTDLEILKAAGISVVFAAGNQGISGGVSPANNPAAFSVGSVDQALNRSSFSNRGPSACDGSVFPEVVAPGENVKTAIPGGYSDSDSGTSLATPHVSGMLALLRQAHPEASVDELEQTLMQTALDRGNAGEDNEFGFGLIDGMAAEALLASLPPPPACTAEERFDGIDQDCNGYDLTIDILTATYETDTLTLTVEATSDLGRKADLELAGFGPMSYNRKKDLWSISVSVVTENPYTAEVAGLEGSWAVFVEEIIGDSGGGDPGDTGGGKGGGKGKKK